MHNIGAEATRMRHTENPGSEPRDRRNAPGAVSRPATTTIRTREEQRLQFVLVLVFVCLAAGIMTVGYLSYRAYAAQYRTQAESQLSAIADLKVAELAQWRSERLGDAGLIFENAAFSTLVARLFEAPKDINAQQQIQSWMDRYRTHLQYDETRLLDPQGNTHLSSPATLPRASVAVRERLAQVVQSGQVAMTDVYRNDFDGRVYITTLIPILNAEARRRVIGILALRVDPEQYLFPFIRRWPTASQTAETLLVRRDGNDALFLNELRFQKNTALALRIPLTRTDILAVKAVLGQTGIVEGVDYRGVGAIGDVRSVPGAPWFLVARIDKAEVLAPVRGRLWEMIVVVSALLFAAAAGVGAVWRQQRARVYRDRYEAAEALREKENEYRVLVENLPSGIVVHAPDSSILLSNPMASILLGLTVDQMRGITAMDPVWCFLREDCTPLPLAEYPVNLVLSSGEPRVNYVLGIRRPDIDQPTWVLCNAYPLLNASGHLAQVVVVFADITARKQAEHALRDSADKLRRAEAMGHLGHWSLDLNTQRISWSDEVFHIHGIAVAAGDLAWGEAVSGVHPDDRAKIVQAIAAIQQAGTGTFEYRAVRPDGTPRHVAAYGETGRDAAGVPVSVFGTVLDVTDLRQKERELQERNDELARFTYTVSHDLKSPLVTVTTFLGFLEQDVRQQDAARIEKDLGYIRAAAGKMARLLDELLELSRVGRKMNPFVETPIQALVQEAQALVAGQITTRGVHVSVTSEPVLLYGDRLRLVEVFQNLLDNAVKFMGDEPAPRVAIGIQLAGVDTVVFVRDNGIGIDPRHQHKLFGLFEKLDPGAEGAGMGLALARRIVEVHGGRIWVESEGAGKGTTFRFTLAKTRRQPREENTP